MGKFCGSCGADLGESKFCPNCGVAVETGPREALQRPVGNPDVGYRAPAKKRKGCLIPFVIVLIIFVGLVASVIYAFFNADDLGATPRGKVSKEMSISLEQADAVLEVLEQCGIVEYEIAIHDEMLDNWDYEGQAGYRVEAGRQKNIIVYLNTEGKVDLINWSDNTLYQAGGVVHKISEYLLSSEETTQLMNNGMETVKGILVSPSTAEFPTISEWKFMKNPEQIGFQSYVDSQNGFGATVRSEFQILLTPDGTTITSFIFDGEELMGE